MLPKIWKFRDFATNVAQIPTSARRICDVIKTNLRLKIETRSFYVKSTVSVAKSQNLIKSHIRKS